MRKHIIHILIISFVFISMPVIHSAEEPRIALRSSYSDLSVSQVQSMPNISIREKNDWGFYGHSTIIHRYGLKLINGDKVVIDHATGLMWHQNGSDNSMKLNVAKQWVRDLNSRGHAGYSDWRLPTVEEVASLLEPSEKDGGLYIDPIFGNKLEWIWTGDEYGSEGAWGVYFGSGLVFWVNFASEFYVRPVRSGPQ
ncbi:MAG: Lcl C-terminal domain-containing protein [Candidatus Scalindua sp.]